MEYVMALRTVCGRVRSISGLSLQLSMTLLCETEEVGEGPSQAVALRCETSAIWLPQRVVE